MPRTVAPSPTDQRLWRLALARMHPDAGGSGELFIWASHVREVVCSSTPSGSASTPPPPRQERPGERARTGAGQGPDRVAFDPYAEHRLVCSRALSLAEEVDDVHAVLLRLLSDCEEGYDQASETQQRRGATYKQLAAIAHKVGMPPKERSEWYRVAERIPMSVRLAGHILSRLEKEAAA